MLCRSVEVSIPYLGEIDVCLGFHFRLSIKAVLGEGDLTLYLKDVGSN